MIEQMKNMKFILHAAITTVFCVFAGFFLMLLVSLCPVESIEKNVTLSAYTLEKEGEWPYIESINGMQQKDNFTDALMLTVAANDRKNGIMDQALSCEFLMKGSEDPYHSFYMYYNRPGEPKDDFVTVAYPRYWHGYLVVLKPLLMFFRYYQIRKIFLITQILLVLAVILGMIRRKLYRYIAAFVLSVVLLSPLVIAQSLQFSWIYYVMLIACIILLFFSQRWKREESFFIFFAAIGCMTSFIDLLTAPLLTLGFPLIFYLCMNGQENAYQALIKTCRLVLCWGIGYAGMWAGKWIIASVFTDHNVITSAIEALKLRTSLADIYGKPLLYTDILRKNWGFISESPIWPVCAMIMAAGLCAACFQKRFRQIGTAVCSYGVLIVIPLIWFYLAGNHTELHAYFAHRIYVVSFFAGMSLFLSCIRIKKTEK